ncbi:MAG: hypothetical protein ACODAG_04285 [Myxococcota bacterium]
MLEAVEARAAVTPDGRYRAQASAGAARAEGALHATPEDAIADAIRELRIVLRRQQDTVPLGPEGRR